MALKDLLTAIEREAEEELEQVRAEARAEARAIRERGRDEAAREEERLARAGDEAVRREAQALRSAARQDAARTLRSGRERAWDDVAEALRRRLAAQADRPEWPAVLTALLEEARSALPAATRAHVRPRDVDVVRRAAPDLRIIGDAAGPGGVVVAADDGRRLDNTLDARLEAAAPLLRRRLADLLSGAVEAVA